MHLPRLTVGRQKGSSDTVTENGVLVERKLNVAALFMRAATSIK
jgi:hypothetical protein